MLGDDKYLVENKIELENGDTKRLYLLYYPLVKEEALAYKNSLTQGVQNLTKEMELKEITSLDLEVDTPKTHSNSISSEAKEQTNNHQIFGENGIEIKPATNKQSLNFKEEISQEAKNIQDTQKESEKKNV